MNLQDLNKEQKQMIMLGIMGVVVFFALGNQLVMAPAKDAAEQASELISEKEQEVKGGKNLLDRDALMQRELSQSANAILQVRDSDQIPPVSGKEFWAQRRIGKIGYKLDINVVVSEHTQLRYFTVIGDDAIDASFWIPYSVDIEAQITYTELIDLLHSLQTNEPYLSVALLKVNPSLNDPLKHNVILVVEWPVPRNEENIETVRALGTGGEV